MTKAKAKEIFRNIHSDGYSENEKAVAIFEVMTGNINNVTKQNLLEVVTWMWHQRYKWQ